MMIALIFSFSSFGVYEIRAQNVKRPSKKGNLPLPKNEPKKMSKEEAEIAETLLNLGTLIEIQSPNTRGLEIDSTGAYIMAKDVIMANALKAKPEASPEPSAEITGKEESTSGDGESEQTSGQVDVEYVDSLAAEQPMDTNAGDDDLVYESSSLNLSKILEECTVNYVPERNYQIQTGFLLKIPKELFSTKWSLALTPRILLNDSAIALKQIILKGTEFKEKQKESYANYESYVGSIVKKEDYDKKFVDYAGIQKDLRALQDVYYNKYYEDWAKQMAFEKWKAETIDKKTKEVAKKVGQRKDLYFRTLRDIQEDKMSKLANGKDTTGIFEHHIKNFEKKAKDLPEKFIKPEITIEDVPREFKEIFQIGRKLEDITNGHMTDNDSLEIAQNRYLFDKIAENEYKDSTREDAEREMIPFPYNYEASLDSVMDGDKDFYYYYPNMTRVIQGATTYRLVLDREIDAFPNNVYKVSSPDTMTYALTSLADLVDPKLVIKETKIYRNMFNRVPIYPKFETNKTDFKATYLDNKKWIEQLISDYKSNVEEKNLVVDSALIRVSASLDGNFYTNYSLCEKRGKSFKSFIADHAFPMLDVENNFRVQPVGEDWKELVRQINRRSDMPNKEEILDMIYATTEPDITEREIKKKFSRDFKIIQDSIYPTLRKVEVIFFIHRPNMQEEEGFEYAEQPGYENGLKLMRERKYWDALQILSQYPDYNTAVCLASMGHNEKAYEVLNYLKSSPDVDYLKAIVSYRIGRESEAIELLQSACEKDPAKAKRVPCDPEIVSLIDKYNL